MTKTLFGQKFRRKIIFTVNTWTLDISKQNSDMFAVITTLHKKGTVPFHTQIYL